MRKTWILVSCIIISNPALTVRSQEVDFDSALLSGIRVSGDNTPLHVTDVKGYVAENDPSVPLGEHALVEWISVPGGSFLMGTDDFENTRPVHEVKIDSFEMSKALVTVAQYAQCVRDKKCSKPNTQSFGIPGYECTWKATGFENYPINCVTWEQANQFAVYAGARLPTEAEWEYAATSGGKNQKYPWGNSKPNMNLVPYTGSHYIVAPVCSKPLGNTESGLCDMTGNMFQFMQDSYGSYENAPNDGSALVDAGKEKVLRGFGITASVYVGMFPENYRADKRTYSESNALKGYDGLVGFRLARTIRPPMPIEWVPIPGGKFKMGTSGFVPGFEDTKPSHDVSVKSFEMSKADVTVAQYMECFSKGKCTEPDSGDGCNWNKPGRQEHPINCVDWNQANQYAKFAGARLPTEAEWEYAARSGGKDNMYPWGNSIPTGENLVMKSQTTAPVCSRPAGNTEQGLCDMAGNVFQWVQDAYQESYAGAPADGTASEIGGPLRVLRGSPFNNAQEFMLRSVYRFATAPGYRYDIFGFRLARSR